MNRRKGFIVRIAIYLIMTLFAVWAGYLMICGNGGILERRKVDKQIAALRDEISDLKEREQRIDWETQSLKNNKKYLEGFARELGFKKEGEIIFKYVKKKQN